jgi:hypothetical protein
VPIAVVLEKYYAYDGWVCGIVVSCVYCFLCAIVLYSSENTDTKNRFSLLVLCEGVEGETEVGMRVGVSILEFDFGHLIFEP